jgi:uncharacterized protein
MQNESIIERPWYTGDGKQVNIIEVVKALVREDPIYERVVHIGTDGQRRRKRPGINYVTVVAIHNKGKGARGFYTTISKNRSVGLQEKLFTETAYSVEIALALCEVVSQENILVHIDANPNSKYASSRYSNTLAGMVMGQGFRYVLKPNSWASSHAADNLLKSKSKW